MQSIIFTKGYSDKINNAPTDATIQEGIECIKLLKSKDVRAEAYFSAGQMYENSGPNYVSQALQYYQKVCFDRCVITLGCCIMLVYSHTHSYIVSMMCCMLLNWCALFSMTNIFCQAVDTDPDHMEKGFAKIAHLSLSVNPGTAIESLKKGIKIHPENANLHSLLGIAYGV